MGTIGMNVRFSGPESIVIHHLFLFRSYGCSNPCCWCRPLYSESSASRSVVATDCGEQVSTDMVSSEIAAKIRCHVCRVSISFGKGGCSLVSHRLYTVGGVSTTSLRVPTGPSIVGGQY
mmetsp:Transcript_6318/g.6238  ORF Transcript_6318/g.6238 Transcript_6318/m.6238 type:complete len:119 (+) Transcript_6318:1335-1691(+)